MCSDAERIADALAALVRDYPADLLGKLLRTKPEPGSHLWDLLESPDPLGRAQGVVLWLDQACICADRDAREVA